jgi:glyoxylase-like metal-dependent hydrolase (beta-lactamase superfamily II)
MIHSRSIGDVRVTGVVEYVGPTHTPEATFPAFNDGLLAKQAALLPAGSWFPAIRRFTIAVQIWIVRRGGEVVIVDTGVGNHKARPAARMNMLNTLVPQWLSAAGAAPEAVTHVLVTHLHSDHVGWNTTLDKGRWTPTFRNARYLLPKSDFAYFKGLRDDGKASDTSIDDSVLPVIEAGLADFIDEHSDLPAGLKPMNASGHTPGMMNYWLESRGERGVFSADVFHHPVQVLNPSWNTAFCILPDAAMATRARVLSEAAATGALVMPCHFPSPHAGYVRKTGDGYRFEPASPGYPGP